MSKHFAIDFDDTFTADYTLISDFVKHGKSRGHKFWCVTARRETEESIDEINALFDHYDCQMHIIFCNHRAKQRVVKERGIKIDIWLDDNPMAIVEDV